MKSKKVFWSCAVLMLLGTLAIMLVHLRTKHELAPFEYGPYANVSWEQTGKQMEIVCLIMDTNDQPLTNVSVNFVSNSGGNSAITDAFGLARLNVGEPEVEQIFVNKISVMHRPRAYELNYPNVQNGLKVKIIVKDPKVFSSIPTLG